MTIKMSMPPNEQAARAEIFKAIELAFTDGNEVSIAKLEQIASSYGIYLANTFAEEHGREAILIGLGAGWGVGPKATWKDRVRVWWAIKRG